MSEQEATTVEGARPHVNKVAVAASLLEAEAYIVQARALFLLKKDAACFEAIVTARERLLDVLRVWTGDAKTEFFVAIGTATASDSEASVPSATNKP